MSLSVGIVGLPNVGKSTLFNALLKKSVSPEGNYPFTTIKPHEGVVQVPDPNLDKLCQLIKPEKCVPAAITFVDIAGLVKNAHQGEGLGNEFLGHIRDVDVIVHVIRQFQDPDIPHVEGAINPGRDREIINLELELAGIQKPTIEWINSNISDFDQVDDLIAKAYRKLDLITFYTIKGGKEVSAFSLKKGSSALDAAAKVHSDFAKNFIKAEVVKFADFISLKSWKTCREQGRARTEGRDYLVQDRNIIEFKIGN